LPVGATDRRGILSGVLAVTIQINPDSGIGPAKASAAAPARNYFDLQAADPVGAKGDMILAGTAAFAAIARRKFVNHELW
jgi:hypothetical protein